MWILEDYRISPQINSAISSSENKLSQNYICTLVQGVSLGLSICSIPEGVFFLFSLFL
jgi:hypothetical protein